MTHSRRASSVRGAILAAAALLAGGCAGNEEGEGFVLRIESLAGPGFPTDLGSGLWVLHDTPEPLFSEGAPDRGQGLEALAEDGDPSALADALGPSPRGVFDALAPGDVREVEIPADPEHPFLTFATMVRASNDVFLAPSVEGIPLFDAGGHPLPERDVSDRLLSWNAGTEIDQAPGLGPFQPAHQPAPNRGPAEGVIRPFASSTRALPLARDLVALDVAEADGVYTLTVRNVSGDRGLLVTPLSQVFWAVHDERFRLFERGAPEPGRGLEALAEVGDGRALVRSLRGEPGVAALGAHDRRAGEDAGFGPAQPGQAYELTFEPDPDHPFVTLAAMVMRTNDAFLSFPPGGIRLLDETGAPRPAAEVAAEMRAALGVWDAGTEANQTPGAGSHQGPAAGDAGPADPNGAVRPYDDVGNDLAGPSAGGFVTVSIRRLRGTTFEVRVENTSGATPLRGLVAPLVYVLHDDDARMFEPGGRATPGLIELAEDSLTNGLVTELAGAEGVGLADVVFVPDGSPEGSAGGPLRPGSAYTFEVTADPVHRWLELAAMPYPSNDTFLAFEPPGIALLDADGAPRPDAALAEDARALRAWDAGTEANQAGAAGADQVPLQRGLDVGAGEGDGTVRAEADPVWGYPAAEELVRVTVTPRN